MWSKCSLLLAVLSVFLLAGVLRAQPASVDPGVQDALDQYLEVYTGDDLAEGSFGLGKIIGWLVFGAVGFVAFVYGKKQQLFIPLGIGLALMIYPYFVSNTILLYVIGAVLCGALYFFRQ